MNDALAKAQAALAREDYQSVEPIVRPLAEAGNSEAQYLLGYLYFTPVEIDKEEARGWLKRAAAENHPEACYWLACMGSEWDFCAPESEGQCHLLIRSAELGYAQAQRDLGCYYATGEGGFPLDEKQGRYWYGRAAVQGHVDAQYNYGSMVLLGEGGPKDGEEGWAWIRRAAANGDYAAIVHLANPAGETPPS